MRVLLIGVKNIPVEKIFNGYQISRISSCAFLTEFHEYNLPDLICFETISREDINVLRNNPLLVMTPVLVLSDSFSSAEQIQSIADLPRVIFCNSSIASDGIFQERIKLITDKKSKPLNARSGLIVKYAIHFININVSAQISRGFLAEKLGVAEDHLTRIFREEMGLYLWQYINLYKIHTAAELLLKTDDNVYQIAKKCGFAEPSYFIRLFKKEFDCTPNRFRKNATGVSK